jgi:hypothetical protein
MYQTFCALIHSVSPFSSYDERLTACTAGRESVREESASPVALRQRRRPPLGTDVDLLPVGCIRQR